MPPKAVRGTARAVGAGRAVAAAKARAELEAKPRALRRGSSGVSGGPRDPPQQPAKEGTPQAPPPVERVGCVLGGFVWLRAPPHAKGHKGMVRYMGPTYFASGDWVGVSLCDAPPPPSPKTLHATPYHHCDGSVGGTRYFQCQRGCGYFVQREDVAERPPTPPPPPPPPLTATEQAIQAARDFAATHEGVVEGETTKRDAADVASLCGWGETAEDYDLPKEGIAHETACEATPPAPPGDPPSCTPSSSNDLPPPCDTPLLSGNAPLPTSPPPNPIPSAPPAQHHDPEAVPELLEALQHKALYVRRQFASHTAALAEEVAKVEEQAKQSDAMACTPAVERSDLGQPPPLPPCYAECRDWEGLLERLHEVELPGEALPDETRVAAVLAVLAVTAEECIADEPTERPPTNGVSFLTSIASSLAGEALGAGKTTGVDELEEVLRRVDFDAAEAGRVKEECLANGDIPTAHLVGTKIVQLREGGNAAHEQRIGIIDMAMREVEGWRGRLKGFKLVERWGRVLEGWVAARSASLTEASQAHAQHIDDSTARLVKERGEAVARAEKARHTLDENTRALDEVWELLGKQVARLRDLSARHEGLVSERVSAVGEVHKLNLAMADATAAVVHHERALEEARTMLAKAHETVRGAVDTAAKILADADTALRDRLSELHTKKLECHQGHLDGFRSLYLLIGDVSRKKERHLGRIEEEIATEEMRFAVAAESLNPDAKVHAVRRDELQAQRDELRNEIAELTEKMGDFSTRFAAVSEKPLLAAGRTFTHPAEELQRLCEEGDTKLVAYKKLMEAEDPENQVPWNAP
eukprot:Sspe_Gene.15501::Locus_5396_Transcript_1_1_Confidence_1.000_Length_3844::g.15501::m.15501